MNRKRGRPEGSLSSPISDAQVYEILSLYARAMDVPTPWGIIDKKRLLAAKDAYRVEIEKIIIDDTKYAYYVFDRVVTSVQRRFRKSLTRDNEIRIYSEIYQDYISRAQNLIYSDMFAHRVLASRQKIKISDQNFSPVAKVKEELRTGLRNIVLKVIDEQSASLGLDRIWKTHWSRSIQSMDKTTTSRTGDARTLGEAISDPTSESKPEKVYGNIVWYLEIKYPEIEIFISYLVDYTIAGLPEGVLTTTKTAALSATKVVEEHIKFRTGIYTAELKSGKIEVDDESFADIAYYEDEAYVTQLIKDIADAIITAQKGYKEELGPK